MQQKIKDIPRIVEEIIGNGYLQQENQRIICPTLNRQVVKTTQSAFHMVLFALV